MGCVDTRSIVMKTTLLFALCAGALSMTATVRADPVPENEPEPTDSPPPAQESGAFNVQDSGAKGADVTYDIDVTQWGLMDSSPVMQKSGPLSLNVQDFGTKGDGVTDDTDAIQRCLLEATGGEEVFFPKGTYLISRTLLVHRSDSSHNRINLRGESATIKQANPAEDILYFRRAHRNLIEGLTFVGGRRQLKLWSKNLDTTHIVIRDCVFQDSSGPAIDDQLRLAMIGKKDWYSNVIEPYLVDTNPEGLPKLTPIDETRRSMCLFVSTIMHINRCSFRGCMQVLSGWADWIFMDDCSIETNPEMTGPVILSGAALALENVTGLAHVNPAKKQWWITMDPGKQPSGIVGLDLKNVKLRTDAKQGWCAVRNEAKFTGGCHVYIIADGCEFQSAGSSENCVLNLVEVPNLINVRNCRETSSRKVNILGFKKPVTRDYLNADPQVFSYVINENNQGLFANLPLAMEPFADPPLPEKVAQQFNREPTSVTLPRMRADVAKQVNPMDFGAGGKGNTDDSAAFRKAFEAVLQEKSLTEVVVPNGVYRMDQPVQVPPRIIVRGLGHAALVQPKNGEGAVFTANDAEHLLFQNLDFRSNERSIAITTKTNARSDVLIDNCSFSKIRDTAITCFSGKGDIAEPNQTTLRISDCTFLLSRALIHNAHAAVIDNAWISGSSSTTTGIIINKGTLHLKSLCGVPGVSNDMRWVDNYYQFFGDRCRFGGEGSGMPAVVNFAAKGYVLLQGSWLMSHGGNPQRVTHVDCEEIPELIALRGNWGWPAPAMMVIVRQGAHGRLKGRWFESGNTAPPLFKDERR